MLQSRLSLQLPLCVSLGVRALAGRSTPAPSGFQRPSVPLWFSRDPHATGALQAGLRGLHGSMLTAAAAQSPGRGGTHDPPDPAQREWERQGASINAASLRHGPALFAFWGAASGAAALAAVSARGVAPDLVLLMDSTAWLALVSSISLTEAWVKFRAPLLERWVGVDVGRRVFRAQYAMEAALASTACGLVYAKAGSAAGMLPLLAEPPGLLLAGAGALLLVDMLAVFPALDLRGKQLIASAAQPASLSPEKQAYVAALRADVAGRSSPPAQLHLLSVVLAFARAGVLAGYVWTLLLQVASG